MIKTEYSIPKRIKKTIPTGSCSVNGLLALELALDTSESHALWRSTLPSRESFKSGMPLFWPEQLQALLPPESAKLLRKQQSKLARDWTAISAAFPNLAHEVYTYNWLLVSTRTFYYTPPNMTADETPEADECLAIVPFGDYFNHHSSSIFPSSSTAEVAAVCKVNYSPASYEFVTSGTVPRGAELFISYGSHSNDFLLVEYGFTLPENAHAVVALDEVILPLLSAEQKNILKWADYLGNYVLSHQTEGLDEDEDGDVDASEMACYRTTTALRLLCMPLRKWKRELSRGFDDSDSFQEQMNELLGSALKTYADFAEKKLQQISLLGDKGLASQKDVLTTRWKEILSQLTMAMERLK